MNDIKFTYHSKPITLWRIVLRNRFDFSHKLTCFAFGRSMPAALAIVYGSVSKSDWEFYGCERYDTLNSDFTYVL